MENPKLCHDKSKHSYMLNMFCFPLLCCQCLGVKKGPNRLSVKSAVEAGDSQPGVWSLCVAATAESLFPRLIHKESIIKAFFLTDKCSYPCPDELLEGMFFSERNIISLYSAGQTTTSLKRCAFAHLHAGHLRTMALGEVVVQQSSLRFLPSESELCLFASLNSEQYFSILKLNFRKALGTGLDDELPEFSTQAPLRCSELHLSCHMTQHVPNFLPESLSKPAKPWQS